MIGSKLLIYALLLRLWGNPTTDRIPNGSIAENGVGKFAAVTPEALNYMRSLGATHVWYIGVLEHATQTDYSAYGIRPDHPDIVKGKAGSPYAVKDYYDVDPDLAIHPSERMREFEALIERTHQAGLKVMMDFIPNHVARSYHSDVCPPGVQDLGVGDDSTKSFSPQNNFYYLPGQALQLPQVTPGLPPYVENPARATGNDSFTARPSRDDWYETIKLNYGVDYAGGRQLYADPIPSTWTKMRDILLYWAGKGVDGFRCDMAEMVPEAFWAWCLPQVKSKYPQLVFVAEIYQPDRYQGYVDAGFDYLYDKVGVYDKLIAIGKGQASPRDFTGVRDAVGALQEHMCYFMENHDEQRLASDFAYGSSRRGFLSSLVSALAGGNPWMHYFGQELGEASMQAEGFSGSDGRTSIFDYWSLPKLQRLEAGGWTTKKLEPAEAQLVEDYRYLGRVAHLPIVSGGKYYGLQAESPSGRALSFVRYQQDELLLTIVNYADSEEDVVLPLGAEFFASTGLPSGRAWDVIDERTGQRSLANLVPYAPLVYRVPGEGSLVLHMRPLEDKTR